MGLARQADKPKLAFQFSSCKQHHQNEAGMDILTFHRYSHKALYLTETEKQNITDHRSYIRTLKFGINVFLNAIDSSMETINKETKNR